MNKRNIWIPLLTILALSAFLPSFVPPTKANPNIIRVPQDESTIQAAINAANVGDTIQVSAGVYFEHIVIKKTLTLMGAGKDVSIIDGGSSGTVVWIEADNVVMSHFTVQNGSTEGVFLNYTTGVRLIDSVVTSNRFYGVTLEFADGNTIMSNLISRNQWGLGAFSSRSNVIRYNVLMSNVNGSGIELDTSSYNIFDANTISSNGDGISLYRSNANAIYRNNFANNKVSAAVEESVNNIWDNGAEGNYWNDYTGQDANGDGIGDTPYTIDAITNTKDVYPLIEPWALSRTFPVGTWDGTNYYVDVVANSTVASFRYDQSLKQVSFNVTGPQAITSFCNVTIPKPILVGNPWMVWLGGVNISATVTVSQNLTHTFLNFTHTHSTLTVRIIGTYVEVTQLKIHNIAVTQVSFSPAELHAGENVSITATVKNEGNFTEAFNVTVFYDSKTIDTQAVTSLLPEESQDLNFTWNTTGVVSGHYLIRARASTLVDETDTLDNTGIADEMVFVMNPLIHNVAVISITPYPTRATIGQSVRITVIVKNEGNFTESFGVSVYCNDTALGSAQEVTSLSANTTEELTFAWITEGVVEGTYVITAKASLVSGEANQADNTLASAENVTVTKPESFFQVVVLVLAAVAIMIIAVVYLLLRRRKTVEKPL